MKHLAVPSSLRPNLRPLILVGLTLLGLVAAQASWNGYRSAREEALGAELEALHFSRDTLRRQEALLGQTVQLLRVLGGVSLSETREPTACSRFLLRQLDHFPEYENLAFLRADGTPYCSARPLTLPATNSAEAPPGKPLLLAFQPDSVAAVLPGEPGADPDGAAVAAVLSLREFLLHRRLPNEIPHGAGVAILDNTGRVLAAHPSRADWAGADAAFRQALLALDTGVVTRIAAAGDHLYVAQPMTTLTQPLRLVIRLPADAAASLSRHALLLQAALVLAALALWVLGRFAVARTAAALGRVDWQGLRQMHGWRDMTSRKHTGAPSSPRQMPRSPGETTVLRAAYDDLKRAFAEKEEYMQKVMLLDDLSRKLQTCQNMAELAQAVAGCAAALFPGSSGTLLHRAAPDRVDTVLAWGRTPSAASITLPLMAHGESLGILNLGGIEDYDPWASTSLAERTAVGMAALRRQQQLRSRAMRDGLTGLYNRRFMEEALTIEQRRALRRGTSIGVLILDVDHFKRFNDTHGHDAGDTLLRGIGTLLRRAVREGDMPCRYGGEEFVVILPGADLAGSRQRAEALREAIAQWNPERSDQTLGPVTVSIGVAALPTHGNAWPKVLKAADQALYEAKRAGRNRVNTAPLQQS